ITHFDGCWYLSSTNEVFSIPHNTLYTRASFDVVYGGHMFVIDPEGAKKTDSAWDAFTNSRVLKPRYVNTLCFRPEIPTGTVVTEGIRSYVNSYVPYVPHSHAGDVEPFLQFMRRLLPAERDRALLTAYLAALGQHPGYKFQWWPVLQGVEGNGKTLIVTIASYLSGEHYTHLPNAAAIARDGLKFNSWIDRKLFVGIEEISLSHKRDFLDELKPIVTNRRIPIEGKGANQVNGDNRANGILCTQHKDGIPVTVDGRRYAIFYTAQQTEKDLERDGMTGDYFPSLYEWLGSDQGLPAIAHYLLSYAIPDEMNPRLLARAPKTSSSGEAIQASLGRAEQEVQDAIEEGRAGFAGGWVSSRYLDALLDHIRAAVPRNKRRALMQSLGYDWHPALHDGRVNEMVTPDGAKPKLYVKTGHLALQLDAPAAIARAYSQAQGGMVAPAPPQQARA
ncbi:MAG: primase-helicase family protein, partial [Caulobacteraceae bacterium]